MITEWLIGVGAAFGTWIAGLFPELDMPEQLVNLDDTVNTIFGWGDGLGAFVQWEVIGVLAAIPLLVWTGGLIVKGIRVLVAHIPFIGGKG